mmetsp:Transcript_21301/g.23709  ORF Transcript_21301/g.23709 Transcript_21301/m.23709 type:complete len:99 (-) Transcript_21301:158-454(-)
MSWDLTPQEDFYGGGPPRPPKRTKGEKFKEGAKTMGLGAFMGMFVGTTVTVVHTAVNRGPFTGLAKRSGAMGASFATIFAVGSLVRNWPTDYPPGYGY